MNHRKLFSRPSQPDRVPQFTPRSLKRYIKLKEVTKKRCLKRTEDYNYSKICKLDEKEVETMLSNPKSSK